MPRKTKKAGQPLVARTRKPANRIVIDHPVENETICNGHYAVRASASICERVEISIDGAQWLPCRNTAGHWWFDLHNIKPGNHSIVVRMHNTGTTCAAERKFKA